MEEKQMNKLQKRMQVALQEMPLVAILRGLKPENAVIVGKTLVEGGLRILEVPLNSPDPFTSIDLLRKNLDHHIIVGAGTVLRDSDMDKLRDINADIAVMPHCNPTLIQKALQCGLLPFPGVFTPTEAFCAIEAGAQYLKIFPANCNPLFPKAIKAVLPNHVKMLAVGGIRPNNLQDFPSVNGFGVGGSLFKPMMEQNQIAENTEKLCEATRLWMGNWDTTSYKLVWVYSKTTRR